MCRNIINNHRFNLELTKPFLSLGLKISDDRKNRNSSSSVCDFGKHLPTILILAVLLFVAEMTTLPMTCELQIFQSMRILVIIL